MGARVTPERTGAEPTHDLDQPGGRPTVKLCYMILGMGLDNGWRQARLLPPDADGMAQLLTETQAAWRPVMAFPAAVHAALVNRFRVMAALDRTEGLADRHGAFRVTHRGATHELDLAVRAGPGSAEEITVTFPPRG